MTYIGTNVIVWAQHLSGLVMYVTSCWCYLSIKITIILKIKQGKRIILQGKGIGTVPYMVQLVKSYKPPHIKMMVFSRENCSVCLRNRKLKKRIKHIIWCKVSPWIVEMDIEYSHPSDKQLNIDKVALREVVVAASLSEWLIIVFS